MPDLNKIWVGEYSPAQNAYHVHPLLDAITANREAYLSGKLLRTCGMPDYVVICVGASHDDVTRQLDELRALRRGDGNEG